VVKVNYFRPLGVFFFTSSLVIRQFFDSNMANFLAGFSIGLGLCLLAASIMKKQKANKIKI
jgi:hypothetical protein